MIWQGTFTSQNTDVNLYLKYSSADRAKREVFCKLYKKWKGNYKDSSKKVNATPWQSQALYSPMAVQTRGLRIMQTMNRLLAPLLHKENLSHPIPQSWQLSRRKYEILFLRDFRGTYFKRMTVAEKDMQQSAIYPVGGEGEFFHRHHLFLM